MAASPSLNIDDTGGDGLPVLFQHGLCGDATQPAEVFPQGEAFRRITVEARGHGRSEAGDLAQFAIATFTADVAAVIEGLRVAPLVVGGISMGAAIALRLAATHPHLVRGLILARPAWVMESNPPNMAPNAEVGQLLRQHDGETARSIFEASPTARRLTAEAPDNLASLLGFFTRQPRDVTAELLVRISADGPGVTREDLRRIDVPTLVIGHGRDAVHPLAHAEALAGLIPGARLVEITPKAEDRARYVQGFRDALQNFLTEFI